MAAGLPVITTNRCNAGLELVREGKNGRIVPAGDARALAAAMGSVLAQDVLLRHMAEESLKTIRSYTIEAMVDRHVEVFNQFAKEYSDAL